MGHDHQIGFKDHHHVYDNSESADAQGGGGVNCAKNKNFEQPKIKHKTIYTGSAKLLPTSSSPTPLWVPLSSGFTTGSPENLYKCRNL